MPTVGDLLAGRYRIDAVLGAGGMASVYRATDERLGRSVAVKVLLPNLAADPIVAERFEREARALAAAAHPAIVAIFDVEPGDPAAGLEPFYVMELCDGSSLADRLAGGRRLPPPDVVAAIAAVAEGLAALHGQGLIHRDVKPHNILFADGRPKLADFGLARSEAPGALSALTADGTTVGTLAYLAPELLAGGPPSAASDVFALGVTTYQALTGHLPRPSGSMREIVESRSEPAATVSSAAPELGAFDLPVAAALAIDPGARPTPTGFAAGLTEALARWAGPAGSTSRSETVGVAIASAVNRVVAVGLANDPGADTQPAIPTVVPPAAAPGPVRPRPVAPLRRTLPPIRWPRPGRFELPPEWLALWPGWLRLRPAWLAVAGVVLLALVVVVSALGGGPKPGATASPGTASPGAASPGPSVSPSPTATSSSPAPSDTPDPFGPARDALSAVKVAIEAARGGRDGLTGSDANELDGLADRVGDALRAGDRAAAAEATTRLRDRAVKLSKGLDRDRRERLLDAIDALAEAIQNA